MANIRFKDKSQETSLQDEDALIMQQNSSNDDHHFELSDLGTYIKNFIGLATSAISGLMSSADKTKFDSFPDTAVPNQALETDGGGAKVWVSKSNGDMSKSVYDSNDDGKVDAADLADDIAGAPGPDTSYGTDGGSVKAFIPNANLTVGLATNVVGTPGNRQVYGTDLTGVKGYRAEVDLIVGESSLTRALINAPVAEWSGQTADGVFNEIFLLGVATVRFPIVLGELWGFEISIIGGKDDSSGAFYGKRTGVIKNIAGTTSLSGAIQVIGTDIVVGVTPDIQITADNANNSLKVEVKGVAAETWDWRATAILIRKD